jgi:hypothetical protein
MTIPFDFPDWMPGWLQLLVVVVGVLLGLAFLFMPFSVFGVKSRLEGVEARLDEIQGEIRSLALRLPEPGRGAGFDDDSVVLRASAPLRDPRATPPIPPAAWETESGVREQLSPTLRAAGRVSEAARARGEPARSEPRLGRPR